MDPCSWKKDRRSRKKDPCSSNKDQHSWKKDPCSSKNQPQKIVVHLEALPSFPESLLGRHTASSGTHEHCVQHRSPIDACATTERPANTQTTTAYFLGNMLHEDPRPKSH